MNRSLAHRWFAVAILSTLAIPLAAQEAAPPTPPEDPPGPGCLLLPHTAYNPDPQKVGAWETVIPAAGGGAIGRVLGMQTVHTVMLPSGKILLTSGSSWRNLAPIETYPLFPNPATPNGIFVKGDDPFKKSKLQTYYQLVNNTAIYDPEKNTFFRIPHPVPVDDPEWPDHFAPNDMFCIGQQHLADGNVLFTGGTQYYSPYRTGNRSTWIFDWRKELTIPWQQIDWRQMPPPQNDPWIFSGFMQRGRWYPSLLPLLDGRMAVWSGFVGFDKGYPEMYQFEINHLVEFFDPNVFDPKNPQAAWKAVDVKETPNSPFTVRINPDFKPTPGTTCPERCKIDNQFDAFKLYPENYLLPDGRIYLTREGDWVSLRTCDTAFMRKTRRTYWATLSGSAENPSVSFSPGPDRPDLISSYGTTYLDPNSGDITLLGGQPTSPGTLLPINSDAPTHFAGGLGSRKEEVFHVDRSAPGGGHWTLDPNFLGDSPQDDRTMHYALILPTRQVLVINGGNYDFYGPVFYPLLLTPEIDAKQGFTGYRKERMADAVEPRLYHNTAVLLPDGRIFISGGNSARATIHTERTPPAAPARTGQPLPNLDLVDLDVYFFADGPIAKGEKGMLTTPTEDWVAEIFSPPYLFIDPDRRAAIDGLAPTAKVGYQTQREIGGKTYFLIHSGGTYDVPLRGLPTECPAGDGKLDLIKLPSATHGWENGQRFVDLPFKPGLKGSSGTIRFQAPNAKAEAIPPGYYMLFYVDCKGKPSVARMVRFDDNAREP